MLAKSLSVSLLFMGLAVGPWSGWQTLKVISEYKRNKLQAISADGRLLLFYETSKPVRTYTVPLDRSKGHANQPKTYDDALRVVDRDSGRELGRIRVEFFPQDIRFIPGTQRIFYKEPKNSNGKLEWRMKIWDLASGEARECSSENAASRRFSLIDAQRVLTVMWHEGKGERLAILNLSDCSQRIVGPVDHSSAGERIEGNISLSLSGKEIAYVAARKIVVRDAATLAMLREINPPSGMNWGETPIYTPDGKFLLVLATNTIFDKPETRRFLFFYDTTTYQLVRQLDITSWRPPVVRNDVSMSSIVIGTAMAVAPDSRALAVAYTKEVSTTQQAQVVLYDLTTGEEIARGSHPPLKEKRDDPFAARIGELVFTPDGQYLLSSTNDTLMWKIDR